MAWWQTSWTSTSLGFRAEALPNAETNPLRGRIDGARSHGGGEAEPLQHHVGGVRCGQVHHLGIGRSIPDGAHQGPQNRHILGQGVAESGHDPSRFWRFRRAGKNG